MAERTPYTSGPLSWRGSGGHYHVENVLGTIAIAFGERTLNGAVTGVIGDEGEGNARLFAAAPDLLAACEAALKYLDPTDAEPDRWLQLRNAIDRAVTRG